MTLISRVSLDTVIIDRLEITQGMPLSYYEQTLGSPTRSEMPGPPPPYGHRNNIIHFYDSLGFFLREHHSTRLISGIDFQLDVSHSAFPTRKGYTGELWVCGARVSAGMEFGKFAHQCDGKFTPHLGHAWFLDGEQISIQFEVVSRKHNESLTKGLITELAVGFRGAHRLNQSCAEPTSTGHDTR